MKIAILNYLTNEVDIINAPEMNDSGDIEEWLTVERGYHLSYIAWMAGVNGVNVEN